MAFKRPTVRSRLAPPITDFQSRSGSLSGLLSHRKRSAKGGVFAKKTNRSYPVIHSHRECSDSTVPYLPALLSAAAVSLLLAKLLLLDKWVLGTARLADTASKGGV